MRLLEIDDQLCVGLVLNNQIVRIYSVSDKKLACEFQLQSKSLMNCYYICKIKTPMHVRNFIVVSVDREIYLGNIQGDFNKIYPVEASLNINRFCPIVNVHKGVCSSSMLNLRAVFIDGHHVEIALNLTS